MKLDPAIVRSVEAQTGRKVPALHSSKFETFMEDLLKTHPEAAAELESARMLTTVGDLEYEERKLRSRENGLRGLKERLFYHRDEMDPSITRPSKGKILIFGTGVVLFLFTAAFLGPDLIRKRPSMTLGNAVGQMVETSDTKAKPTPVQQNADPFAAVAETAQRDRQVEDSFAGAAPSTVGPTPENNQADGSVPNDASSGGSASQNEGAVPVTATPAPAESVYASGAQPVLPSDAAEDPGLGVYNAALTSTSAPEPGLKVYGRGETQGTGQSDPFATDSDSVSVDSLRLYGTATTEDPGLMAFRREGSAEARSEQPALFSQSLDAAQPVRVPQVRATTNVSAELASPPVNQTILSPLPQGGAAAPPYAAGETIQATLQTGIVAVDSTPLPVLARAEDDSVWQGEAVLSATGRVELNFYNVFTRSGQFQVTAVGQAPDGYLGLPSEVGETTPALVSDLARGTLRGVTDYVGSLGQVGSVTEVGGAPVVTRDAPPLEASIASSVAQLFAPPEGDAQQALVRVAEVPAQTPLQVVVLGSN